MYKLSQELLRWLNARTRWPQDPDDVAFDFDASPEETRRALHNLCENGCITDDAAPFHLTMKGAHFQEFRRLSAKERWKERAYGFFSGVAVTVLATIILKWLLG